MTENAPEDLLSKVTRWFALHGEIKAKAIEEAALRREIFEEAFPNAGERGKQRFALGFGKDLQGEAKTNYSVNREAMEQVRGDIPAEVFKAVVRFKPEVSASQFEKVSDKDHLRLLSEFITSKPGMPGLEIVDAKKR